MIVDMLAMLDAFIFWLSWLILNAGYGALFDLMSMVAGRMPIIIMLIMLAL
jgi:hypothetical protein